MVFQQNILNIKNYMIKIQSFQGLTIKLMGAQQDV